MHKKSELGPASFIYLSGITLISLAINPFTSYEPFNAPKLFFAITFGAALIFFVVTSVFVHFMKKEKRVLILLLFAFLLQATLTLLIAPTEISVQLFGIDGRNTGYLLYFSLTIFMLFGVFNSSTKLLEHFIKVFIFVGVLNVIYGVIQSIGWDPFDWTNPYSPVFSFFGNPNFSSAFMGIFASILWPIIISSKSSFIFRTLSIALVSLSLYVIVKSDAQQGLLIYFGGLLLTILIKIYYGEKTQKIFWPAVLVTFSGSVVAVADILQKTPWDSILYKSSVSNRGDLWRAAIEMSKEFPIFGVGFDGYDFYYREFRDLVAIEQRGNSTTSTSAHNVFLDLLTSGGWLLLLIYFGITVYIFISAIKTFRRKISYDPLFTGIFVAWIAYQVQSTISINQIGIAIWGWSLGGLIVGYEFFTRNQNLDLKSSQNQSNKSSQLAIASILSIAGVLIGRLPLAADIDFRSSVESREIERVKATAYKFPQSAQRMLYVATLFRDNNLDEVALEIAQDATRKFPRSFENWYFISNLESAEERLRAEARSKIVSLDPKNESITGQN